MALQSAIFLWLARLRYNDEFWDPLTRPGGSPLLLHWVAAQCLAPASFLGLQHLQEQRAEETLH